MSGTYAFYPPPISGNGIAEYATFAAFPSAVLAGNGALALALDTGILYESNGTIWRPIGGPGVVLAVGTFDSGTPSVNGAHIDSNALIMQSASATDPGLVNLSTQTFAGVKTFSSAPNFSSLTASLPLQLDGSKNVISAAIDLSGTQATGTLAAARFPALLGDVTTTAGSLTTSLVATTNSTLTTLSGLTTASSLVTVGTVTSGTWNATTIAVNHGGTGQITAAAAFNALSPITTTGDMIYSPSGATSQRLAIGSTGNVLTVSGGVPTWAPPATSGTVTSVGLSVPATSIFGVSGSPVTGSGTLGLTTTGTSGGIPYFSSTTQLASSAALTASQLIVGGGAGAAPSTLAAGTANQYLKMNATPIPAWYTVPQPTTQTFLANFYWTFTVSSANATVGATYTNNGLTYTVVYTIAGGTTLVMSSATSVALSGTTLTKASGTGDATITESNRAANGTYQLPTGAVWIRVRLIGGGGGGGGGGNSSGTFPGSGGSGGNTTFGSAFLVANGGGAGGWNTQVGAGGTASIGSGASGIAAAGGQGGPGQAYIGITDSQSGGTGASSALSGGGAGSYTNNVGQAAVANSGGGGGGGGTGATGSGNNVSGGGGSAGGFVDAIIQSPSSTYIFSMGAGGTAGAAGATGGFIGGAGGSGAIYVEEFYI